MSAPNEIEVSGFEAAARLIAVNESDVGWLSYGLLFWIWPQMRQPVAMRGKYGSGLGMFADFARIRRGRADVVRALTQTLPRAAKTIEALTGDWTLSHFLVDDALGPGFGPLDHIRLIQLLHEIRRRGVEASRSPQLVAPSGKAKAGRNRALAPGQIDEKVACAATVMVAWKIVRNGDTPGPQTRDAADAAQILFALGSAPAGRYDQVKHKRFGGDSIKTWRPHFNKAALPSPALERMNTMCAGELEFIRKWHAGDPAARAFPTMMAVNPPGSEPI